MALTRRSRSRGGAEELVERVHAELRRMREEIETRLEQMTEAIESRRADDEVEAVAAERVRGGGAGRTEDGAQALRDLGIRSR